MTETHPGDNLIDTPAVPFWVTVPYPDGDGGWNYNVDVYPKNALGTPGDPTKVADEKASVLNDEVTWTITMPVDASPLPYNSFTITDDLSSNIYLDLVSWGEVKVGTTTLVAADDDGDNDYTISTDNSAITFTAAGLAKLDAAGATEVTVTLVTKVVEIPANGVVINDVTVRLNGQPKSTNGTTNWGEIVLYKVSDAGNKAPHAGAEFELYDTDPTVDGFAGAPIATGTTNSSGEITWTVWVGNDTTTSKDFWVVETKAPAGHVLPANPVESFTVTAGKVAEGQHSVPIANHKPEVPLLPLTGSTGSMVFLLVGLGLIGSGAAIAGVRRTRMNS